MTALKLRGITWNHSRALPPLVAASQRYEELHPQIRIQWEKRTLDEFGHASLADLAQRYDLLIVDHPMLGEVHRDGILLYLKPRLQPESLTSMRGDALGPCFEVINGARNLAKDIARIQHEYLVRTLSVALLCSIEKPKLARHDTRIEEVAADIITSTAPDSTSFWRTFASPRPALEA